MNITLKIAQETAQKTDRGRYEAAALLGETPCIAIVEREYAGDSKYKYAVKAVAIDGKAKSLSDYAALGFTVSPDCDIAELFAAVHEAAEIAEQAAAAEARKAERKAAYQKSLHLDPAVDAIRAQGFEVATQTEEEYVADPETSLYAKKNGISVKFYIGRRRNGGSDYSPKYENVYECESYRYGDNYKKWSKSTKKLVDNIIAVYSTINEIEAAKAQKKARENSVMELVQAEIAPDFKEESKWDYSYGRNAGTERKEYLTKRNDKSVNLRYVNTERKTATMTLSDLTFDQIRQIMAILETK